MGLFDTDRKVAEAFSPGEYIQDELEARGWMQSDLADILGRNPATISQIISGRQPINPTLAKQLGAAFGTSAQVWMNLQSAYELWREQHADTDKVERKSKLYALAPVKELIKRHWIEPSESIDVLEHNVCEFLEIADVGAQPSIGYAARKSGTSQTPSPALIAWLKQAKRGAQIVPAQRYSDKKLSDVLPKLRALMQTADGVRDVPKVLAEAGVRFVVVEHLPQTRVDGATFWLENSPVIVMSLRYDRLDNFWHTLLHEIDHVLHGEGKSAPCIDELVEGETISRSPEEQRCETFAATFSIPREELDSFIMRVRPYFTPEKATGFALRMKVHPAIAAGQIRNRLQNYSVLSTLVTAKVRAVILETAACDGWNRTFSVPQMR